MHTHMHACVHGVLGGVHAHVCFCILETSTMRQPRPNLGCCITENNIPENLDCQQHYCTNLQSHTIKMWPLFLHNGTRNSDADLLLAGSW